MGRKPRRAKGEAASRKQVTPWVWILPPLLAVLLYLPCLRFTFIWDDFEFLRRALAFHPRQLLPEATADFYRPISREIYFGLVVLLGEHKALFSHLINGAILTAAIVLYTRFLARVAGPRRALFAGVLFASMGQMPLLVAWVSGAQDLFAILFLVLALRFRWERRETLALLATGCALLSKETAAAFLPALALLDWILGRKPYRFVANGLRYGLLMAAWASIHPGIRELVTTGFHQGATVYLGTDSAQPPLLKMAKYLLMLFHLPIPGIAFEWPPVGWGLLAGGALIAAGAVRGAPRETAHGSAEERPSVARVAILALALAIPPLVLASALVRHWLPYYVVIAGLGGSLLVALPLSRAPNTVAWIGLVAWIALGLVSRGLSFPADVASERNFRVSSETLRVIESGFRSLYRSLPRDAQAVVSVQVGGASGVYRQFSVLQPLPVWYGDPTIRTLRAVDARDPAKPEFLFVVTPWLDVAEIDPETYRARSSGRMPEYVNGETAIRLYAMGTFASGETDRAVRLLTQMPEVDPSLANAHRRLASAFLTAAGRSDEADSIRHSLPPLPRNYALETACGYLADPLERPIDEGVLTAFSIAPDDTASMMKLVRCLEGRGNYAQALACARRLRNARPLEASALEAERRIEGILRAKAERSP